jgi:hypothetical protein
VRAASRHEGPDRGEVARRGGRRRRPPRHHTSIASSTQDLATLIVATPPAAAAPLSFSLFGDAQNVPGGVQLRSDASPGFGGVDFNLPGAVDFEDITQLQTQYQFEADDSCAAGSPRFQLNVDTDGDGEANGNIFVAIGPSPTFTGCPPSVPQDSGNLIGNNDACRYDTSQIVPATQCNTYAGTLALLATPALANATIVGIQLVVDSGFAFPDGEQTVVVNPNVAVNFGPPTDKEQCKNGGWRDFNQPREFKNQGDCIQFVNTGK